MSIPFSGTLNLWLKIALRRKSSGQHSGNATGSIFYINLRFFLKGPRSSKRIRTGLKLTLAGHVKTKEEPRRGAKSLLIAE